jgi:nicotinate phosphoribosyltransferase
MYHHAFMRVPDYYNQEEFCSFTIHNQINLGKGTVMTLLWDKDAPMISSLMETDVYKILMLNYDFRYYTNTEATFSFINRTDVDLLQYIDLGELREQLAHIATLRFTEAEIAHLMSWGMFRTHFEKELRALSLTVPVVSKTAEGRLSVQASGLVTHSSLWEIYVLAIVSESYIRGKAKAEGITEKQLYDAAMERVLWKVDFFNAHPYLKGSQFGLRRRLSGPWEQKMTEVLLDQTSFFTGASNVRLAYDLDIEAQGTNAHQNPMLAYAYARGKSNFDARRSVYKVLEDWQNLYGQKALVMLTDGYGSDAFFDMLPDNYVYDWRGFRHDSGDPIAYGEKVIALYKRYGIDPMEKMIIFSDGLDDQKMLELYKHFEGRISTPFGVGTWLSNDTGGLIKPLSLVMKITEAAGRPTVKLSDNLAKATGDPAEIEEAKRIFGYSNTFSERAVY